MEPLQIVAQIESLIAELKVSLTPSSVINNETELAAALVRGGNITLAPKTFVGNFVATAPATINAAGATIAPADLTVQPLTVNTSGFVWTEGNVKNGAKDRDTIVVGSPTATDPNSQPTDVVFDRVVVVAGTLGGHRAFALHGRKVSVVNSTVLNFWETGRDSQAIWICNGPGPYKIENNFLEGAGENILLGGAALPCGVNPSAVIRGNILFKNPLWKGDPTKLVKNSFEVKSGVNVLFEGNKIDGCWGSGQIGTPIVLTPRNQDGKSIWVQVDDIRIVNNIVTNCPEGYAVNLLGTDDINITTNPIRSILIERNMFMDTKSGLIVNNPMGLQLTARYNSFLGIKGNFLAGYQSKMSALTFSNNVARSGNYGIHSSTALVGLNSLTAIADTWTFEDNVIEQCNPLVRTLAYPVKNTILPYGTLDTQLDGLGRYSDGKTGWQ